MHQRLPADRGAISIGSITPRINGIEVIAIQPTQFLRHPRT